ncbi:tetratricopeptide repeat protein 33 [Iris pallida]|uniref:Tetratricopeptide repeat protein 33 n=2 Tax=Iris pallida TaxID=29817 RepID=A0AAX6EJ37_IRIPA|nr:tetratricopeptide repeat protein 33 [Iris pallida]
MGSDSSSRRRPGGGSKQRPGTRTRLVRYEELPEFLRDNEFRPSTSGRLALVGSTDDAAEELSGEVVPARGATGRNVSGPNNFSGGLYNEALRKWEAAIMLTPEKAKLHEQKAQVLLEIGDAWSSLKAAARATELDPLWAEAWITLGRAQLNYGEPDIAMESFDKALAFKPNHEEALIDRNTASHLVKRRKQSHSTINSRYEIREK